jgi:tetratricopeptide (TPR) repeat protein
MGMRLFHGLPRLVLALAMLESAVQILRAQEDASQAVERLQAQAAASPERLDLVMALGNSAVQAGQFDTAIASFQKVLETVKPDSREAGDLYLRMGEAYRRKGDTESAIASLTFASQLLPDQAVVMGTLALVLDAGGKKAEAEQAYRATLQLDPEDATATNNLAFLMAERGEDLDQALVLAQRAMELAPDDADTIDTAGWVQLKRKQTDIAIGLFARAVGKEPGNDEYRQHLLQAVEAKGSQSATVDELKSLLAGDLGPENLGRIAELLKISPPEANQNHK